MEILEALKQFAIDLLQSPILAESALRVGLVLIPATGAHIFLYVLLKKFRPHKDNSLLLKIIGYSANLALSGLMTAAYAENNFLRDLMFYWKAIGYGLSAIFVHFVTVELIEKKYKIRIP